MAKDLLIGSHVGMNGPDYYLGSVKEAISYGATTFMFYTGAPQNTFRKPLSDLEIEEGRALLKEQGFDENKIVVHAPYIMNPANKSRPDLLELTLDTIIAPEFQKILDTCKYPERLGVCLDTCHIHDAGYDVNEVDDLFTEFDRIIGLDRLLVVHVNDSKNIRGAHKDRHENIGFGHIGFEALHYIASYPDFATVPKILESPYVTYNKEKKLSAPPYRYEIEMLKQGVFDPEMVEKIMEDAQK